jgi:hypothetical protein
MKNWPDRLPVPSEQQNYCIESIREELRLMGRLQPPRKGTSHSAFARPPRKTSRH